jgi:hypothetical protein
MKFSLNTFILQVLFIFSFSSVAMAQMPHDALYMPKKRLCTALIYTNNTFSEYWEGTLLRNNLNIGKNITQSAAIMPAYGINDKLNVIAMLPYITTHNTAGNLLGQSGLQDFSLWLKYKFIEKGGFSLNTVLGGSVPTSNYVPDFLPMSIGLKAKTVSGKIVINYTHPTTGLYLTAHGTYTLRSNIKIDRDAYQSYQKVINSNEVGMPNATDAAVRIGLLKKKIQAEIFANYFSCVKGDNIRRNDMPFPTNNMQATAIGFYGKVQPRNLGMTVQVAQTIKGLNVGKSLNYSVGLIYQM